MKIASLFLFALTAAASANPAILFIANPSDAGPQGPQCPAGGALLARHLGTTSGLTTRFSLGWPSDPAAIASADALVIYSDGLGPFVGGDQLAALKDHHAAGKGLALIFGAARHPDPEVTGFLNKAVGGHLAETGTDAWKPESPALADHPAARGVGSFDLDDVFLPTAGLQDGASPLLSTASGPSGAEATEGSRVLAWTFEGSAGARGFVFTGGGRHGNWSDADFRRLVLNGIAWSAGVEIPENGVAGAADLEPVHDSIEIAIARADLDDVRRHFEADPARIQPVEGGPRPPLDLAILRKQTAIALYLISVGADTGYLDGSGRGPVHSAVSRDNPEIVAALLKAGANPNLRDRSGWTPLHHAAAKNQLETTRALLDGGADPMTLSELGGTPLHEAATGAGRELIELLLARGVDPAIKSSQGVTALDLARQYENLAAIEILSK